jgi:hypothetical protein
MQVLEPTKCSPFPWVARTWGLKYSDSFVPFLQWNTKVVSPNSIITIMEFLKNFLLIIAI